MQPSQKAAAAPTAPEDQPAAAASHVRAPVPDLIDRFFSVEDGVLRIGELPCDELAARHGTPFFVHDAAILARRLDELLAVLPPRCRVAYSVKANPNPAILAFFAGRGLGLEIASAGELLRALAAGCPADRILFAGPGKTDDELELAVAHAVGEIHVESLGEAHRLARIARNANRTVSIALRVNPATAVEGGGMRMGGRAVPFGIDEDQLDDVVAAILDEPSLHVAGVHLFMGTQILDHTVLLRQYGEGIRIARDLVRRTGRPVETIDLGGGLGVPYLPTDARLDLAAFGDGLTSLIAGTDDDAGLAGATFLLEPGRFLVAEAGVYITRVTEVKTSRGRTFVVTDGGMHHHLAASGNLGQAIKRNFPIAAITRLDETGSGTADIVGPLCTPLDTIGRNVELPAVERGDLIGIFQSGAYALTASPTGFLSRPTPAEVLVEGGRSSVIRPAGRPQDYVQAP